ncbi:hypothetical protein DRQ20_03305 [bacterium]|nr:MAG: hypothetical protein DRQ20_03305 [bacterium]
MKNEFNPLIVPFVCDWCSLQAADFIGLTRLFFPKKANFIRVTCSGRVNPELITYSFRKGADGVLIMGCRKGDCNYRTGNYQAERVVKAYRYVLSMFGINPDRVRLNLESDTEILHVYEEYRDYVKKLGPIGEEIGKKKEELGYIWEIIDLTLLDEDIKWLVGREWTLVTLENVYGEPYPEEDFQKILERRLEDQFLIAQIAYYTKDKPMTPVELSKVIGKSPREIFSAIVEMKRKAKIELVGWEDRAPKYQATIKAR